MSFVVGWKKQYLRGHPAHEMELRSMKDGADNNSLAPVVPHSESGDKRTLKTALQILVGILMWLVSVIVCYYLGLIMNRPGPPNWYTGAAILALFVAAQLFAALVCLRHVTLQVFFGLALSAIFAIAWLYLGPFWEQLSPDGNSFSITWRSDLAFVLLVAACQWISFWAFRLRIALRIFVGIFLCALFTVPLLHSETSFSWERHLADGSFTIGWRTDLLFFLLLAATQGASFLGFRLVRTNSPVTDP